MSMSDCRNCQGAVDSRSMTRCQKCGAPICADCAREGGGCCADCCEELQAVL